MDGRMKDGDVRIATILVQRPFAIIKEGELILLRKGDTVEVSVPREIYSYDFVLLNKPAAE